MNQLESVWDMHKRYLQRDAFSLIEVMIAVIIISVVIMALLQMQGNNMHMFSAFSKKNRVNQYGSFFIANEDYGHENKTLFLDDLLSEFELEDELRRELKKTKVEILYQEINSIGGDIEEIDSGRRFEIGKSILKTSDSSSSYLRLRVK